MTGRTYKDVCIAAAGRVLMTVEAEAEIDLILRQLLQQKIYTHLICLVLKMHMKNLEKRKKVMI